MPSHLLGNGFGGDYMLGIIDYGMSNLTSVSNALKYLRIEHSVFDCPSEIDRYDRLILPGVGAFGLAMNRLYQSGFHEAILKSVSDNGSPLLGICLGMQLLFEESEEHGRHKGLGLIKGKVRNFRNVIKELPVPHVGWNTVEIEDDLSFMKKPDSNVDHCFYFVHSFYCTVEDDSVVCGKTEYGIKFDSVLEKGNIWAVQFHPEKSQSNGLQIFKEFSKL
jgi:imidazole glycerol-phosphate synthase subunit HisH